MIAASRESNGAIPVAWISAAWVSCQLSFTPMGEPVGPKRRRRGSATTPGTPRLAREGPMPRRMTRLASSPVTMKPPTITPSPVSTRRRVEMLRAWAAGLGLGDGLGEVPGLGLGEVPGLGLGEVPGLGLGEVPGLGLGEVPGLGLGEVPGLGLGEVPGLGLGEVPGLGLGEIPGL